jgi:hypothetical protein
LSSEHGLAPLPQPGRTAQEYLSQEGNRREKNFIPAAGFPTPLAFPSKTSSQNFDTPRKQVRQNAADMV